jgi:hypothetical protein
MGPRFSANRGVCCLLLLAVYGQNYIVDVIRNRRGIPRRGTTQTERNGRAGTKKATRSACNVSTALDLIMTPGNSDIESEQD